VVARQQVGDIFLGVTPAGFRQFKKRAFADARAAMRAERQNADQRVAKIESTLQQLANVVVLTARQDEKLDSIERRVDRLEQASPARHP
jgi:uncharacterized protein (DUF3084 family)